MRGGGGPVKRGSGGADMSLESMSRGWVREEFCRIFVWPDTDDGVEFIRRRGAASGFSQEEITRFTKTQMAEVMRKVVLI
jgi:hypothetical protein